MIGRFASHPDPDAGELPVCSSTVGQRYSRIHLRLTHTDFAHPHVQSWLHQDLVCRLLDPLTGVITIEVGPP